VNNNEADQIDEGTPDGVALGVSKRMSLFILMMAAAVAYGETAFADDRAETKSAVDAVIDGNAAPAEDMCVKEILLSPPGKLHAAYFEKIKAIQSPLEVDESFLRDSKLSDIRYNPRLFHPKKEGETKDQGVASLKDETARRLRAYTNQTGEWFTLDFKKMGSDKKTKLTHENNIQLGEILVDTDVRTVLIQRADGTAIKARRGVCEEGGYKGRIGFLDSNKQFVPVFSGDKFRILTSIERPETYDEWLNYEDYKRGEHKRSYQTQRGSAATFMAKDDALKAAKKLSYDPNDIKVPTQTMVEEANRECKRDRSGNAVKNYYLALGKENFMELVKYCAAEVGVPVELMLTVMKKESGFILGIIGDHGKAVGLGQLHEPRWKSARSKPKFAEIMARFTDKPVKKMKRSESALVDVLSVAMVLKGDLAANKIEADYLTRLTPKQIAYIRFHYHVPGTFAGKNKEKGFNKRRAGYESFAREVLRVRKILDELSGKEVPNT
jgi:hypothetical protein